MTKKILFFIFLFLTIVKPIPVFAITPPIENSSSPQTTTSSGQVLGWWDNLWNLIVSIFKVVIGTNSYVAKTYEVPTIDTTTETNDYQRQDKDYSSRAYSQESKKYRRGVWFSEVLTGKYQDNVINKGDQNCHEIVISELIYYYYQKGEKILYQRGKTDMPIDYDPSIIKVHRLRNPDSCYINAYNNIQDVPQGIFENSYNDPEIASLFARDESAAAATSTQINENIRTIIPDNYQGETAPDNNDTGYKIRQLIQDTDKQEETMLLHFIPENKKNDISCNNNATLNRNNIRDYFGCNLNPSQWSSDICQKTGLTFNINNVGCGEKHVLNGPGVSQRGAHGLGLSGYLYKDIMKLYLGSDIHFDEYKDVDKRHFTVIMIDDTDFNEDGISDNDVNCEALVKNNYASWYTKPDLYTGTGGYTKVDGDWVPCEDTDVFEPVTKNFWQSGPNYALTEKCYPAVNLSLHYYLLGIAEVPKSWHLETWKALTLTHRYTALEHGGGGFLKNNSDVQVFQCNEVLGNVATGSEATNKSIAVELTRDELAYNNSDNSLAYASARTAFCGPGSNNPSFDGFKYEKISYLSSGIRNNQTIDTVIEGSNSINGICFEGVSYPFDTKDINKLSNKDSLKTYQYNQSFQVLGQTNDQNDCRLDERLFSPLDQLITAYNAQNVDNKLSLISCYRSTEEQEELWQQYLKENNDDKLKTISQINYPGTSPHQTGLAIDFADKFGKLTANSSSYQWLASNAHRFNFYHHPLEPEHWEYKP